MCDTNGGMLPMGVGRVVADVRARVERQARHPLPGRHRLRRRQLPRRRRGRRHPRAGHRERLRRARRQRRHVRADRQPGHQDGPAGRAGRVPARAAAGQPRHRRAGQHRARRPPALRRARRRSRTRPGLHASAIKVSPELYNHLDPAVVGNDMRILVTEMAGRASVELKGRELGVDLAGQADAIGRVVDQVKVLEADGWSFEAADASFELLLRAELPDAPAAAVRAGELQDLGRALGQRRRGQRGHGQGAPADDGSERIISTAEGNGPVNALDNALRQALVEPASASWPRSPWPTTRCASSAGRAARAPPPGCSSHHRRRGGVDHRRRPRQHRRGLLARAGRRARLRRPAPARRGAERRAQPRGWISPIGPQPGTSGRRRR